MKAILRIHLPSHKLEGSQWESPLSEEDRRAIDNAPYLAGEVDLVGDDCSLSISDDLEHLVRQLSVTCCEKLLAGEAAKVALFSIPDDVTLTPSDNTVLIETSWEKSAAFPRAELVEQLLHVGRQYIGFLDKQFPENQEVARKANPVRLGIRKLSRVVAGDAPMEESYGELDAIPDGEPE